MIQDRPHDGRPSRILTVVDGSSRERLGKLVARSIASGDVLALLGDLFVAHGPPGYIRSDNGPELCARAVRLWLHRLDVGTLYIESGSRWENGYCESFNGKLQDELLNGETFYILLEAKVLSNAGAGTTTAVARTPPSGTVRRRPRRSIAGGEQSHVQSSREGPPSQLSFQQLANRISRVD